MPDRHYAIYDIKISKATEIGRSLEDNSTACKNFSDIYNYSVMPKTSSQSRKHVTNTYKHGLKLNSKYTHTKKANNNKKNPTETKKPPPHNTKPQLLYSTCIQNIVGFSERHI